MVPVVRRIKTPAAITARRQSIVEPLGFEVGTAWTLVARSDGNRQGQASPPRSGEPAGIVTRYPSPGAERRHRGLGAVTTGPISSQLPLAPRATCPDMGAIASKVRIERDGARGGQPPCSAMLKRQTRQRPSGKPSTNRAASVTVLLRRARTFAGAAALQASWPVLISQRPPGTSGTGGLNSYWDFWRTLWRNGEQWRKLKRGRCILWEGRSEA